MISFALNGRVRQVDAEPDKPLLWVLREDLNIVGPKFRSGVTACGACTVHVEDQPLRSCSMAVGDVARRCGRGRRCPPRRLSADGLGTMAGRSRCRWAGAEAVRCLQAPNRAVADRPVSTRVLGLLAQGKPEGNAVENPPYAFAFYRLDAIVAEGSVWSASGARSAIRIPRSSVRASSTNSHMCWRRIHWRSAANCGPARRATSRGGTRPQRKPVRERRCPRTGPAGKYRSAGLIAASCAATAACPRSGWRGRVSVAS
jgi:hypothetical protein